MQRQIKYWWDDNTDNEGWYAVVEHDGRPIIDSMKIDFPVGVELYDKGEEYLLQSAFEDAYPDYDIRRIYG